jgi:hypothetical protein
MVVVCGLRNRLGLGKHDQTAHIAKLRWCHFYDQKNRLVIQSPSIVSWSFLVALACISMEPKDFHPRTLSDRVSSETVISKFDRDIPISYSSFFKHTCHETFLPRLSRYESHEPVITFSPQYTVRIIAEMLPKQQQQQQQQQQRRSTGAAAPPLPKSVMLLRDGGGSDGSFEFVPTASAHGFAAAPDPGGYCPVRTTRSKGPLGSGGGSNKGGILGCDGASINTAPTEDEEEEDENDHLGSEGRRNDVTTPTLLGPSVAWSWYKPKRGTRSLFEMDDDDDDDDVDADVVDTKNKTNNVRHVDSCRVACLSAPQLVASTTADSFDFSEVGWGNKASGGGGGGGDGGCVQGSGIVGIPQSSTLSPLRTMLRGMQNHAATVPEYALAWTGGSPMPTSPTAWMQPQPQQTRNAAPKGLQAFAKAASRALESPTNFGKASGLVEDAVSPLAMESPLNKPRRQLSGEAAGDVLPTLALDAPLRSPPPATSRPLLHARGKSRSSGDLRKQAAAPAVLCPFASESSRIVMAQSTPASSGRRRSSVTAQFKSPKIITSTSTSPRRRASPCAAAAKEIQLLPLGPVPSNSNSKAVRTVKIRAKDLASFVGEAQTSLSPPTASPNSLQQGGSGGGGRRRSSSSGADLKAVWDALRKVNGASAASPSTSSSSPPNRLLVRRGSSNSRRVNHDVNSVAAVAAAAVIDCGGSKSSVCAVAPPPTPVRSRSRSLSRPQIPPPQDRLGRSSSLGTGMKDDRGRRTSTRAERTSRSRSRARQSEPDRGAADESPVNDPPALDRRHTKRQDPEGSEARNGEAYPSTPPQPLRRSRSFDDAPRASPTMLGLRRSPSMGSFDHRQRYARPGELLPRRRGSGGGSESPVARYHEGGRRGRRPSLGSHAVAASPDRREEVVRPTRRLRRSLSRQRRAARRATACESPAPLRRRSDSKDPGEGPRCPQLSTGQQSCVASPRSPLSAANGVLQAGTPPAAHRRTGSDAARDAGFTDEQLRSLQDAGFHISPRRRNSLAS